MPKQLLICRAVINTPQITLAHQTSEVLKTSEVLSQLTALFRFAVPRNHAVGKSLLQSLDASGADSGSVELQASELGHRAEWCDRLIVERLVAFQSHSNQLRHRIGNCDALLWSECGIHEVHILQRFDLSQCGSGTGTQ